jgi:putative nucleotidyltransferase with HDIG domain
MNEPPVDATDDTIQGIAEVFARVVDAMSGWTATHTAGVAATAVALARLMKFSLREQIFMRTAGLLHDLGKLSVPTRILDKRGDLSPQEWVVIKGHTYHTYKILETAGFPRQIAEWAAFHHERIDGNGYPFHLKGRYLTLGSRIMAVADTFTALTEDRPYRGGVSCTRAITIMHRQVRNGGLDGDVLAVLAKNRDYVDTIRRREQERYARDQRRLGAMIPEEPELRKTR